MLVFSFLALYPFWASIMGCRMKLDRAEQGLHAHTWGAVFHSGEDGASLRNADGTIKLGSTHYKGDLEGSGGTRG